MSSLEFSAPYNNNPETLEELFRLKGLGKNRIREIYLSGPHEYSGSGRVAYKLSLAKFVEIINRIHSEEIRVNLIMNPTCEGSEWYHPEVLKAKMEYLSLVHTEYGVEAVTIANPLYIKEVRRQFPNLEICASVLGDIDCVQRAVIYSKAGANVITTDININRDLELLKQIKEATNVELKLMVNEGCLYKCPFRKFHNNYISHITKDMSRFNPEVFLANCLQVTALNHSQILKSCWIRPEDMSKYCEITNFFKIVGRDWPKSMVVRATKAYLEESWDGDLLDIVSSNLSAFGLRYGARLDNKNLDDCNFFEKVTSCNMKCINCDYCEKLARKLIKFGMPDKGKFEDLAVLEEWLANHYTGP